MRLAPHLLVALIVLVAPATAVAGPWTKAPGEVYAKLSQSLYFANGFVDTNGDLQSGSTYTGYTTAVYAEIGLVKRLQLSAYVPFSVAVNRFPDDWRYMRGGLTDSKLGLQFAPVGSVPFAIKGESSIPLYDVGDYDGPFPERIPMLGDGQVDLGLSASYGGSLPKLQSYAFAELGYLHRTEWFIGNGPAAARDYKDGITWGAQFGRTFAKPLLIALGVNGLVPVANNRFTKGYVMGNVSTLVRLPANLGIEASFSRTLWARNSARGNSFSLGVSFSD